jgi:hypothetical protein
MLIGGIEFPDKCFEGCTLKDQHSLFGQGGVCTRCPIFNCAGDETLLDPDEYRADWAKEWKRWFDEGMVGVPYLTFTITHTDCIVGELWSHEIPKEPGIYVCRCRIWSGDPTELEYFVEKVYEMGGVLYQEYNGGEVLYNEDVEWYTIPIPEK